MMTTKMYNEAIALMNETSKMVLEDTSYDSWEYEDAEYDLQKMINDVEEANGDEDILNKLNAEKDRIVDCINAHYEEEAITLPEPEPEPEPDWETIAKEAIKAISEVENCIKPCYR